MANSIMIDLNDPRTEKIADVISNKTAKKILGLLADNEFSESEIANKLGMPLNTIEYNIKKLEDAGLIEKVKGFLWSVKGKRIHRYKISNKRIVISPRSIIGGIIPSVLISGAIAFGIKIWIDSRLQKATEAVSNEMRVAEDAGSRITQVAESSGQIMDNIGLITISQNIWLWFFAGALFGLLVFLIWNYLFRRME